MLLFVVLASVLLAVRAQQPGDDDVRGAFLSSRPKTTNANAPSRRHKPRNTNINSSAITGKNTNAGKTYAANTNTNNSDNRNASATASGHVDIVGRVGSAQIGQAIGLGYTLFMRDSFGKTVRVEPTREFHNGDSIRISLEPNVDGYLYVFHTENDSAAEMIYPDARLDSGDNSIEAHVPFEVPSSEETDERLRWFTFYGNGGTERLYVVLTREPLNSIPTREDLVAFCASNKEKCPWHPPAEVWSQIQEATKANVKVVTSNTFGQTETDKEKIATTRGLGLDQSAPQPSVIRMSVSTTSPLLVTVLDLIHK